MSATRCYCGTKLRDGVCLFRCPPEANPRHLRAEAAKRKKIELDSNRSVGTMLRHSDVQDAADRVSPVEARNRQMYTRNKAPSAVKRDATLAAGKRKRIERRRKKTPSEAPGIG
jgi:hypothetical protein